MLLGWGNTLAGYGITMTLGSMSQAGPGGHRDLKVDPDQNSRFLEILHEPLRNTCLEVKRRLLIHLPGPWLSP